MILRQTSKVFRYFIVKLFQGSDQLCILFVPFCPDLFWDESSSDKQPIIPAKFSNFRDDIVDYQFVDTLQETCA